MNGYDVCFYPTGFMPLESDTHSYAVISAPEGLLSEQFKNIAVFCGPDQFSQFNAVTTGSVIVPKYISYRTSHIPVMAIGKAFKDSPSESVILQDCITYFGEEAFRNAHALTSLTLPMSLELLDVNSLAEMASLKELTFRSPLPPDCMVEITPQFSQKWTVNDTDKELKDDYITPFGKMSDIKNMQGLVINVPRGSLDFYLRHPIFSELDYNGAELREYDPEMISPANPALSKNLKVAKSSNFMLEFTKFDGAATQFEIPNTVAADDHDLTVNMRKNPYILNGIGYSAFEGADITGEISIPDNIIYIKDAAFKGCNAESLTIGTGIRLVGDHAFSDMSNLQTVTIQYSEDALPFYFSGTAFDGINSNAILKYDFSDKRIDRWNPPFSRFSRFENTATGIESIYNTETIGGIEVSVNNREIDLSIHDNINIPVTIATTSGIIIYDQVVSGNTSVAVSPGLYIVKSPLNSSKILVK